ncbi:MAG: hypothetical protein QOG53_33 [Frankiales bacterium]|jgi:uncharacterized protein (TIGR03083 family)|nr:hypothetical protein [Frankiales bacterium]
MNFDRYLACIDQESERLAAAAKDLDAEVPPCPGWTVRDVVRHNASVYWHKVMSIRLQRQPQEGDWPTDPAPDEDLVAWFRDAHRVLHDELTSRDPSSPSYTWWPPDQTVGFWYRRMAQEVAVHRADVESAYGAITPVDEDLALDGIDEVLRRFLADPDPLPGDGPTVDVSASDQSWRVTLLPDGANVSTDATDLADAIVSGEPSEVYLWLWGRKPDEVVRFDGDTEVIHAVRKRLADNG